MVISSHSESLCFLRALGFNNEDVFEKTYEADKVFNVAETALCIVQSQQVDVSTLTRIHEMVAITAERGYLMTLFLHECQGNIIPPLSLVSLDFQSTVDGKHFIDFCSWLASMRMEANRPCSNLR
jgi:hypothetical protein